MKVLIIDDEALVRRSLARAFKSKGHEVVEAVDGEQGLAKWLEVNPDIVFVDVLMPKMTGPQLLKKVNRSHSCRVILMSAYSGEDHLETTDSLGVDEFIPKPFQDIFSLVSKAEELVR